MTGENSNQEKLRTDPESVLTQEESRKPFVISPEREELRLQGLAKQPSCYNI